MKRILMMFLRNFFYLPVLVYKLVLYSRDNDKHSAEEKHKFLQWITERANKGGNVKIQVSGTENIPKENGFIVYPNHEGMYDALAVVNTCDKPIAVIMKKEVSNVPFVKQVAKIMGAKAIDRDDVRQGMKVILEMAEEVQKGRNFLIFAEGTRSKEINVPQEFKGGSFKAATKAKCPIVPAAIIDGHKPFDSKSLDEVTVKIHYLKPLTYEEYKDMKTTELAAHVRELIVEEMNKHL